MKGAQNNYLYLGKGSGVQNLPLYFVVPRSLALRRKRKLSRLVWVTYLVKQLNYPFAQLGFSDTLDFSQPVPAGGWNWNLPFPTKPELRVLFASLSSVSEDASYSRERGDLGVHRRPGIASPLCKGIVPSECIPSTEFPSNLGC